MDECLEVGDYFDVATEREFGLDEGLAAGDALFLEPGDRRLSERLIGEFRQGRPAPERERIAEERSRLSRIATRELRARQRVEVVAALRVELVSADLEQVPRWTRDETITCRPERAPKAGHE